MFTLFFICLKESKDIMGGGGTVGGTGGQGAGQGAVKGRTGQTGPAQRRQCILVSVVFTPSRPATTAVFGSYLSSLYSVLTNNVSPVRACLIIWLQRFRRTQKEDNRGLLSIQSSLVLNPGRRRRCFKVKYHQNSYIFKAYPLKINILPRENNLQYILFKKLIK